MSKTVFKNVAEAIKAFEATQIKYEDFGAFDTEPRTEFVLMLERIAEGEDPKIPGTVAAEPWENPKNQWDLYSSMSGYVRANKALTTAAQRVVEAAQIDRVGLLAWLVDNYGFRPF